MLRLQRKYCPSKSHSGDRHFTYFTLSSQEGKGCDANDGIIQIKCSSQSRQSQTPVWNKAILMLFATPGAPFVKRNYLPTAGTSGNVCLILPLAFYFSSALSGSPTRMVFVPVKGQNKNIYIYIYLIF